MIYSYICTYRTKIQEQLPRRLKICKKLWWACVKNCGERPLKYKFTYYHHPCVCHLISKISVIKKINNEHEYKNVIDLILHRIFGYLMVFGRRQYTNGIAISQLNIGNKKWRQKISMMVPNIIDELYEYYIFFHPKNKIRWNTMLWLSVEAS